MQNFVYFFFFFKLLILAKIFIYLRCLSLLVSYYSNFATILCLGRFVVIIAGIKRKEDVKIFFTVIILINGFKDISFFFFFIFFIYFECIKMKYNNSSEVKCRLQI